MEDARLLDLNWEGDHGHMGIIRELNAPVLEETWRTKLRQRARPRSVLILVFAYGVADRAERRPSRSHTNVEESVGGRNDAQEEETAED